MLRGGVRGSRSGHLHWWSLEMKKKIIWSNSDPIYRFTQTSIFQINHVSTFSLYFSHGFWFGSSNCNGLSITFCQVEQWLLHRILPLPLSILLHSIAWFSPPSGGNSLPQIRGGALNKSPQGYTIYVPCARFSSYMGSRIFRLQNFTACATLRNISQSIHSSHLWTLINGVIWI